MTTEHEETEEFLPSDPFFANQWHNDADNWNGGGLHFSNDYGFGLIDALAAVRLAESWPRQSTSANEASALSPLVTVNQAAPDNDVAGLIFTLDIAQDISIESVGLRLNWSTPHPFSGDVRITLTGPDDTVSILHDRSGGSTDLNSWTFKSNAFRGELSAGRWTVNVADLAATNVGTVSTAQITAYGSANTTRPLRLYQRVFGLRRPVRPLDDTEGPRRRHRHNQCRGRHIGLRHRPQRPSQEHDRS